MNKKVYESGAIPQSSHSNGSSLTIDKSFSTFTRTLFNFIHPHAYSHSIPTTVCLSTPLELSAPLTIIYPHFSATTNIAFSGTFVSHLQTHSSQFVIIYPQATNQKKSPWIAMIYADCIVFIVGQWSQISFSITSEFSLFKMQLTFKVINDQFWPLFCFGR